MVPLDECLSLSGFLSFFSHDTTTTSPLLAHPLLFGVVLCGNEWQKKDHEPSRGPGTGIGHDPQPEWDFWAHFMKTIFYPSTSPATRTTLCPALVLVLSSSFTAASFVVHKQEAPPLLSLLFRRLLFGAEVRLLGSSVNRDGMVRGCGFDLLCNCTKQFHSANEPETQCNERFFFFFVAGVVVDGAGAVRRNDRPEVGNL